MKEIINKPETITDRELSITRILNAPRELVWKVWTEPEHIKHWWDQTDLQTQFTKWKYTPVVFGIL